MRATVLKAVTMAALYFAHGVWASTAAEIAAYIESTSYGDLTTAVNGNTVTVAGNLGATPSTNDYLTLNIDDGVTVVWRATLSGTPNSSYSLVDINGGSGEFRVESGYIENTGTGRAISNKSNVKITVSGNARISSQITSNNFVSGATIYLAYLANSATAATERLVITGGTVENTSSSGDAIINASIDAVNVSGGTVSAAGGYAILNYCGQWTAFDGTVNISGGTVSSTSGAAIRNESVSSSNYGTVNISGGTVSTTSGYAIYNSRYGIVEISSGTVSAVTGRAIYNYGTVNISGGTVTSEAEDYHVIYNYNTSGTVNISGGTVSANGSEMAAVYGSNGTIKINGGTVLTAQRDGYAVYIESAAAIILGGNPTITGRIYSYPDKLSALTTGDETFVPGQKIYAICFPSAQYTASKIAVNNGRDFLGNFALYDTDWALITAGPHLAVSQAANKVSFFLNGGTGTPPNTIGVAQNSKLYNKPATNGFTKLGYVNDGEWYIDPAGSMNTNLTVEMRDEYGDGWNGSAALRISVNGNILTNAKLNSGGSNTYTFNVNSNDAVEFHWVNGTYDDECAFAVYYAGTPPSPPFNPESGTANDVAILLSRKYGSLEDVTTGTLLGSVTIRTVTPPATDTKFEFGENGTIVSSNITLYLKWIEPNTITFNSNGGSAVTPESVTTVGSGTLAFLPTPTFGGYTLAGWFTAAEGGTAVTTNTVFRVDATIYAHWTPTVSVLTPNRVIPPPPPKEEAAVIAPVTVLSGEFTAGPNPISKQSGIVNFYRQGRRVAACELYIYDATGNIINKVKISDNVIGNQSRRIVGKWDLTDKKGRQVPEGTYLVKGVLKTSDGKSEKVSVILGVR